MLALRGLDVERHTVIIPIPPCHSISHIAQAKVGTAAPVSPNVRAMGGKTSPRRTVSARKVATAVPAMIMLSAPTILITSSISSSVRGTGGGPFTILAFFLPDGRSSSQLLVKIPAQDETCKEENMLPRLL